MSREDKISNIESIGHSLSPPYSSGGAVQELGNIGH